MPTENSTLQAEPASRTELDARLSELYGVAPRTIRLWRRKGAPLDEGGEAMADWIDEHCHPGKKDGAEVRAARLQKLTLQIEALTLRDREEANGYLTRAHFTRLYAPMAVYLRETLRETLLVIQPPALVNKSEPEVRELAGRHFDDFLTKMRVWCQEDRLDRQAKQAASVTVPALPASPGDETGSEIADRPKGKRGRVADPEMEALRLQKLTFECAVLERENGVARGDLLPLQACLDALTEHFHQQRHDLKNCLTNEQPATMTGHAEAEVRTANQKTFERLNRRLRASLDALDTFLLPATLAAKPTRPIP